MKESGDPLLDVHTAGVKRHRQSWLTANEKAIHAAVESGVDYSTEENKLFISRVVLHVLDAVNAP